MLIYGAGGHAKVLISCLKANDIIIPAVFDDNPLFREIQGIPVLGKYDV